MQIIAQTFSATMILNFYPRLKTHRNFLRAARLRTFGRFVNSSTKEGPNYQNHFVVSKGSGRISVMRWEKLMDIAKWLGLEPSSGGSAAKFLIIGRVNELVHYIILFNCI